MCLMLSGGLAAQGGPIVSLIPGDSVVVTFDDGQWRVAERSRAGPLSLFETQVVAKMQEIEVPPEAGVQPAIPVREGDISAPRDAIAPGMVRITFREVLDAKRGSPGESHAILSIDNGYDHSLLYRAAMHKRGEQTSTDVCEVIPQMHGLEHWPYRIDRLDLSDLRLEAYSGGDPRCE
jgi:hypothetical protein